MSWFGAAQEERKSPKSRQERPDLDQSARCLLVILSNIAIIRLRRIFIVIDSPSSARISKTGESSIEGRVIHRPEAHALVPPLPASEI